MTNVRDHIPFAIAVTGTIGSGKSLVGSILAEAKVPVLDCDEVVHNLLNNDSEVQSKLRDRFGSAVFGVDDVGDTVVLRHNLGQLVFNDLEARHDLERIVHPSVIRNCASWVSARQEPVVAVLVPLLFEAGLPQRYDETWTVTCDEPVLRHRLKTRNNYDDKEIDNRLAAQLSQKEKASRATKVIDNSGSIQATRDQVLELLSAAAKK
jgi:dephospho-CoA kinase